MTGSRCPVNNATDVSTREFHLLYEVQYTRDMTSLTMINGGVLDLSGGDIEWNIGPGLSSTADNTVCNDTVCNVTDSVVVGTSHGFGKGLCAGTMLWSYLHQHFGSIRGTMYINNEEICSSTPVYGTDPDNLPGNEKGCRS